MRSHARVEYGNSKELLAKVLPGILGKQKGRFLLGNIHNLRWQLEWHPSQ